jgi:hypothetical protein
MSFHPCLYVIPTAPLLTPTHTHMHNTMTQHAMSIRVRICVCIRWWQAASVTRPVCVLPVLSDTALPALSAILCFCACLALSVGVRCPGYPNLCVVWCGDTYWEQELDRRRL